MVSGIVVLYGILIELSICRRRIKNRHFDKVHFGMFEVRECGKIRQNNPILPFCLFFLYYGYAGF